MGNLQPGLGDSLIVNPKPELYSKVRFGLTAPPMIGVSDLSPVPRIFKTGQQFL